MSHRREPAVSHLDHPAGPGRTGHRGSEQTRRAGDRAFQRPPSGPQWPGREPSEAERSGVPPTDTSARSPLGVGASTWPRRAEQPATSEPESGRRKGLRGRARRPYGTPEPEGRTGVTPDRPMREEPTHKARSHLPTGDQAG